MMSRIRELGGKTFEFLRRRRGAYCQVFKSPGSDVVLQDLARFCRANDSTFNADPRIHAVLEGRREVWLRIQQHLNLPPERLFELYGGIVNQPTEDAS